MRGKKAKIIRRQNLLEGLPANGRTEGPNITDLEDTRADRRLKTFRKRAYAAQMRESHPVIHRAKAAFWTHVFAYLTMPEYREGLGSPTKAKKK